MLFISSLPIEFYPNHPSLKTYNNSETEGHKEQYELLIEPLMFIDRF